MKKDDLLKKAREDSAGYDERELRILHQSFGFGMMVVAILCVVFSVIRALQGKRFFEFTVIIFAYMGAFYFYQYFRLKMKKSLLAGIACAVPAIGGLVGYFLLG